VDAAAGSIRDCQNVPNLQLHRLEPDAVRFSLPADEFILDASRFRVDLCSFPYLHDVDFGAAAHRILVTTGKIQRPYTELGPVNFGTPGSDMTRGAGVRFGSFGYSTATRTFTKATPAEVNTSLQRHALLLYGKRVDAVINVTYESNPRNDVFGTGLAVQFRDDAAPVSADAVSQRLETLDRLRARGAITDQEYENKRSEILQGL
jgi:hypothetical protein